jgi:hypothetical protein
LMPNSKLSRNAEYVSNAQLSQASSPENRPLDSTKTQFRSGTTAVHADAGTELDNVVVGRQKAGNQIYLGPLVEPK